MISKKLYWAKWKENIRRRGWTLLLCFVTLFWVLPAYNLIELNSMHNAMAKAALSGATAQRLAEYQADMRRAFAGSMGFSEIITVCGLAFAVLFAVQGFSWLFDQRKTDLYMSVPVSASKRFALIWANGVGMFGGCYLFHLLLGWGIGAAYRVADFELLAGSALAFFVNMLAFAAMYHVALLAVMLTGNVLTALLGCFVLFVYEPVVRCLYGAFKSGFFISYCRADQKRLEAAPYLSPFWSFLNFGTKIRYGKSAAMEYVGEGCAAAADGWCGALARECALLLFVTAAAGVFAYFLFRKRRTEAYHHAIAFPAWKPVLEVFLLVPFAMLTALLVSDTADDKDFFLFAGGLGGILFGHAVIWLIYERDLRAIVKKRGAAFAGMVLTALALCVFRFDLTGFDDYLPEAGKVKSVSLTLENDYSRFGYADFSGQRTGGSLSEVLLERMNSGEPETIGAVLAMASAWQEAGRPTTEDKWRTAEGQERVWKDSRIFVACYQLTDGRRVYRRFYADTGRSGDELDVVTNDASYRSLRYQIYGDEFAEAIDRMRIIYDDGRQDFLYTLDKNRVLDALRGDFEGYGYRLIETELPCGILRFELSGADSRTEFVWSYPVYESFAQTKEVLSENGIDAGKRESVLAAEDVREITVRYYFYGDTDDMDGSLFEKGEIEGQEITCTFEDREEIGQILSGLYPSRFEDVAGMEFRNMGAMPFWVRVSLTQEAVRKHYTAENLIFLEGGVPDFVKKKIRESAVYR